MKNMMNIRREVDGWVVRMVRDGIVYSKYFRFSDGGVLKSKKAAIKYRDKLQREVGKRQWRNGPNMSKAANNTSGVIGVSKNKFGRWVASWNEDGKQRFKTFALKREAVAHRKAQEKKQSK